MLSWLHLARYDFCLSMGEAIEFRSDERVGTVIELSNQARC